MRRMGSPAVEPRPWFRGSGKGGVGGTGLWPGQLQAPRSVSREAQVALARPLFGSVGAACVWTVALEHSRFLTALAFLGFLLNLFNLIPVVPLDGGRAAAALHPAIWLAWAGWSCCGRGGADEPAAAAAASDRQPRAVAAMARLRFTGCRRRLSRRAVAAAGGRERLSRACGVFRARDARDRPDRQPVIVCSGRQACAFGRARLRLASGRAGGLGKP